MPPTITIIDPVGPREIADRLRVSVNTVHSWRNRGILPDPDVVLGLGPIWSWIRISTWALETGREIPLKWAVTA